MITVMTLGSVIALIFISISNRSLGKKIDELKDRAKLGDAAAMLELGDIANQKANAALAETWYRKAAHLGSISDLYQTAKGLACKKRIENCIGRLVVAAEYDYTPAKLLLAQYLLKHGASREQALALLESAAIDGDANSQYTFATNLIEHGKLSENMRKVQHYLELASEQGHLLAKTRYETVFNQAT